jgi:hypothetical protein
MALKYEYVAEQVVQQVWRANHDGQNQKNTGRSTAYE